MTTDKSNTVNVRELIAQKSTTKKISNLTEKSVPFLLFLVTAISIVTTIGIVVTLSTETIEFFKIVPIWDFFTGTVLKPLSQNPEFGILPLITGTITSSLIAMLVAAPIGMMAAIYLSEYASDKVRKILKPMLEVLAGIPTIVYGFFAFTFVTPFLREFILSFGSTNFLIQVIFMGLFIIPILTSSS